MSIPDPALWTLCTNWPGQKHHPIVPAAANADREEHCSHVSFSNDSRGEFAPGALLAFVSTRAATRYKRWTGQPPHPPYLEYTAIALAFLAVIGVHRYPALSIRVGEVLAVLSSCPTSPNCHPYLWGGANHIQCGLAPHYPSSHPASLFHSTSLLI